MTCQMIKDYLKKRYLAHRYRTLIHYIADYHRKFEYGFDENELPVIRYAGLLFNGFPNASADLGIYQSIRNYLPADMKPEFYRLTRDIITRYVFPHMMPQLKPSNGIWKSMNGFHGQHKDSLQDIRDPELRDRLIETFTIRNDDIIINCGAYIGFGDMRVSRMIPNGKLISVEAKRECFDILNCNIATNKITNVWPVNKAIWNKNGKMNLNTGELQSNSLIFSASHFGSDPKDDSSEEVSAVTIDSLTREFGLNKVDYITLTLNGAEVEAIDGMQEVLSQYSPRIRLAGWYKRDGVPIWKICSDRLKPFGYKTVAGRHGSLYAFK